MGLYGSLNNRIEENRNHLGREIKVGDDITMYFWSDRNCYFVTKVVSQKNIFVKKYNVCADQEKEGGMGHQNWLYFKTAKEMNDYLRRFGKGHEGEIHENSETEWAFRYGHWYTVTRYNLEGYKKALEMGRKDCSHPEDEECVKRVSRYFFNVNDEELEKVLKGEEIVKYNRIKQGLTFGVRDYYYDWEF